MPTVIWTKADKRLSPSTRVVPSVKEDGSLYVIRLEIIVSERMCVSCVTDVCVVCNSSSLFFNVLVTELTAVSNVYLGQSVITGYNRFSYHTVVQYVYIYIISHCRSIYIYIYHITLSFSIYIYISYHTVVQYIYIYIISHCRSVYIYIYHITLSFNIYIYHITLSFSIYIYIYIYIYILNDSVI